MRSNLIWMQYLTSHMYTLVTVNHISSKALSCCIHNTITAVFPTFLLHYTHSLHWTDWDTGTPGIWKTQPFLMWVNLSCRWKKQPFLHMENATYSICWLTLLDSTWFSWESWLFWLAWLAYSSWLYRFSWSAWLAWPAWSAWSACRAKEMRGVMWMKISVAILESGVGVVEVSIQSGGRWTFINQAI